MSRPDLQGEYGQAGWQACDATPQESSNGNTVLIVLHTFIHIASQAFSIKSL